MFKRIIDFGIWKRRLDSENVTTEDYVLAIVRYFEHDNRFTVRFQVSGNMFNLEQFMHDVYPDVRFQGINNPDEILEALIIADTGVYMHSTSQECKLFAQEFISYKNIKDAYKRMMCGPICFDPYNVFGVRTYDYKSACDKLVSFLFSLDGYGDDLEDIFQPEFSTESLIEILLGG